MATRAIRLYLIMSWLVTSYLLISISRESSLSDVNIFNGGTETFTHRDVSELLLKKLNELRSSPVVKLRGLSHSKRKGRPMNRFEAFICLNVIWFILRLRSLVNLINDLLLRAGDIEINPGPTPPGTPDCTESSTPGDLDQIPPLVSDNTFLHGQTLSIPEATSSDMPTDRKGIEQTTSPVTVPKGQGEPLIFPEGKMDETRIDNSSSEYLPPQEQGASQLGASLAVRQECVMDNDREDDPMQSRRHKIDGDTVNKRPIPPTADDEPAHTLVLDLWQNSKASLKRKSLPPICVTKKAEVKQLQEKTELLCGAVKEQLKRTGEASQQLTHFITAASKLYMSGKKCPVCPTCLNPKKKKDGGSGGRASHVIPNCILKYYWKIHSTDKDTDCMYDFSTGNSLAAHSLTYHLLCGNCEEHYSKEEELLLSVYIQMAADPDNNLVIEHKDEQSTTVTWLEYILANILFRGILTNVELDSLPWNEAIIEEVYSLWKFCRNKIKVEVASEQRGFPNLKVFLLPNKPFHETLDDFMFPFEMLVRMPRCTELIVRDDVGTFFYTKFDIFHIVLPLCEKSRDYFNTFNNGLTVEHVNLHLRWTVLEKAEIVREGQLIKVGYPDSANLKDHFPEALLAWCTALYETYVSRLYNHPRTMRPFLTAINRYHGAQYSSFDTKERMQKARVLKDQKTIDKRPSKTTLYEDHLKFTSKANEMKLLVSTASCSSPLRRQDVEEAKCLKAALADTKEELGYTRRELGDTRERLEQKESELEQTESELAHLKENDIHQKIKIERIQSDLYSSRVEVQAERDTNSTLKEDLYKEREAQVQAYMKEFEKISFLYVSSLRHKEHPLVDGLKEYLAQKAAKIEYMTLVYQGTYFHQGYEELSKKYGRLLRMSPPTSPTSPNPQSL